jgi:ribosome-binding protein aMBF1 (putative translation factor)
MRVVEKTRHIDVNVEGSGASAVAEILRASLPLAVIEEEGADEYEDWEGSDLQKDFAARKTPGKLVRAYRARADLSLVQLAEMIGTKYPNLSAIENDRRAIGLVLARKLGKALGVEYRKFLE